jgi:lysozyme
MSRHDTCPEAVELIKHHESLRLKAYLCPAGKWTIGWGHTGDVRPGMVITEHQARAIFEVDLDEAERAVEELVHQPLTRNEFSALVSFVFNFGARKFAKSTLLKRLNEGRRQEAAAELAKWIHAWDEDSRAWKVLPGLVERRRAERELFLRPMSDEG